MKYLILAVLVSLNVFASGEFSEDKATDQNGFITCFQSEGKTYFFDWDPYINTQQKSVRYFEAAEYQRTTSHRLRSCKDQKYIIDRIPPEILFDIAQIKNQLPEDVVFPLSQVASGAHTYRSERTAKDYIQNRPQIFKADSPEVLSRLRVEVGDQFASEVLTEFTKSVAVKNKSCESLIGTCDFYLCQEQKNPCGLDGYNLGFGYKYCSGSKFKLLNEMTTALGKSWVTEVFQCLQKRNVSMTTNVCSEIKQRSYDSHPDCYVQAGFCQLKGAEKVHIFGLIKKEILSFQTVVQGVDLIKQCGAEK